MQAKRAHTMKSKGRVLTAFDTDYESESSGDVGSDIVDNRDHARSCSRKLPESRKVARSYENGPSSANSRRRNRHVSRKKNISTKYTSHERKSTPRTSDDDFITEDSEDPYHTANTSDTPDEVEIPRVSGVPRARRDAPSSGYSIRHSERPTTRETKRHISS